MTEAQGLRLRPFLATCSGLRVGKETHCPLFLEALRWIARMDAPWHQWPAKYGKGELSLSPLGSRVRPGRRAAPAGLQAGRSGSVHPVAGPHGHARAHPRGGHPPKERDGSRARSQPGRRQHPDPHPNGSTGPSLGPARDGRPAPRPHPGPDLGEDGTDARPACLIKESVLR